MVNQGDIIIVNFDPRVGHEQAGNRPAVVISNNTYNSKTRLAIICPITNADNKFPTHIKLDSRTKTTGVILCEHLHSFDIDKRGYKVAEKLPADILEQTLNMIFSEIETESETESDSKPED
jgi:mRNA interferase MazF